MTRNGVEVVKIRKRNSDLRPNHFSFHINFQLPPRQNQTSCLPDESCHGREVKIELHIPVTSLHGSHLEANVNIGSEITGDSELTTKLNLSGKGRPRTNWRAVSLNYNITNEILLEGRRAVLRSRKYAWKERGIKIGIG